MAEVPVSAALFYNTLRQIRNRTTKRARLLWDEVSPAHLDASWNSLLPTMRALLVSAQVEAAWAGMTYGSFALAEQGHWVAPEVFVDPDSFGGWSSSGASLDVTLGAPTVRTKQAIASGATIAQALAMGWQSLAGIVSLQASDAGRGAAGVDTAARKGVGYVRMLNPPSCDRCTILAGKWFRWNQGFQRHPRCDCVHVMSSAGSTQAARDEGLIDDPYEYFTGLSESEQAAIFGEANARAIRDGSDIYQVTNASMRRGGMSTTVGTTRRANFGRLNIGQQRLTPEGIYSAFPNREEALAALRRYGYVLPGGQAPGGSLVGVVEGFGQMGRGGTRVAAREAILQARLTGVRNPTSRATMTVAERRLFDSEQRYLAVLQGRNPTGRGPLTPQIAAIAEADYRRWLASGGQIFTT